MSKRSPAVAAALAWALAFSAAAFGAATPSAASAGILVALDRCNGQTIDDAVGRVRDYDRHPPGNAPSQLLQRFGAIADALSVLTEEREILTSVCSNDAQRENFIVQIAAGTAWALVLESDIASRLNASCPAAAAAFPQMMLSDAWLALANVINANSGFVPPAFTDVIPKIQTHAQAAGLALPAWADTSQYWRDQLHAKAKTAIATCPSPSPQPTST